VREQVCYANSFPGRWRIRKVAAAFVVEAHLAVLYEQHDARRGQLFVQGGDGKDRVKPNRNGTARLMNCSFLQAIISATFRSQR
jgi:hypothetical protein